MKSYEKLGIFYLGKEYDPAAGKLSDNLVLYDSRDLTTHAVILGMTGSGKTGLGVSLLEEALIDRVPVIAIDPKGDLTNLCLAFPELKPTDLEPWVDPGQASAKGLTTAQMAAKEAETWRKGLASWDQGPERIALLKDSAEVRLYTPGSTAATPVSLLASLDPPPPGIRDDAELFREEIDTTVAGLLALVDIEADPVTSREHILLANILDTVWGGGSSLDLAGLIRAIQTPPFARLGVMDLESFFPEKERFKLALRLNNLLASPGFQIWMQGPPLNVAEMLYGPTGKPRASVFTISHLPQQERMFFVTLLLNRVLGWARAQSGTASLRAILYMDEIMGYLPPLGNPPSKPPLLTLLKQARAFGLGLVLSTQNPVDLDYKALSNAGTWFLGRLQTERDKARVVEGLSGAGQGGLDPSQAGDIIGSLGKRTFLLHNVHDDAPRVFQARWALSYLAGPLTREQIRRLKPAEAEGAAPARTAPVPPPPPAPRSGAVPPPPPAPPAAGEAPLTPPGVAVFYLPASGGGSRVEYLPAVLGAVRLHYRNPRQGVDQDREVVLTCPVEEGAAGPDWEGASEAALPPSALAGAGHLPGASHAPLPPALGKAAAYKAWGRDLMRWARLNQPLIVYSCPSLKLTGLPGEGEAAFRGRVALAAREKRDLAVLKLKDKYASKLNTLNDKLLRARMALEREEDQAQASQMDTVITGAAAVLDFFMGGKGRSASRVGTAARKAGRLNKESGDVDRARRLVADLESDLALLRERLSQEAAELEAALDPAGLAVEALDIPAKAGDMTLLALGLAWLPYRREAAGGLAPDWPLKRE